MRALPTVVVVVVMTLSTAALACPNCVDPRAANQKAFIGSTAFLSIVPLLAIFSIAFWLYRKARRAEQEQQSQPLP